jgi:hypothetical protein
MSHRELDNNMPEDASLEDIIKRIAFVAAINEALEAAEHEEGLTVFRSKAELSLNMEIRRCESSSTAGIGLSITCANRGIKLPSSVFGMPLGASRPFTSTTSYDPSQKAHRG